MSLDSSTVIDKRAGEKLLISMDFGSWLSSGETIASITSVVGTCSDGADITITSQTISGSLVLFYADGGTAGCRYAVTVTITTSLKQILIGEGPLRVI